MQSWLAPVAVVLVSLGAGLVLDHDGDGADAWSELAAGTSLVRGDSDGDGLPDGHELAVGLPPTRFDADGDGLGDGVEVARGADPRSADTDGDGIVDAQEPDQDCDGDGFGAVASSDDDGDGRPDRDEPLDQRCQPDADADGVLDGAEGTALCVVRRDCDRDGLPDAQETALDYDPLDPDTFDTGLTDAVTYAFQQGGQAPGADADQDGIPDPWEEDAGLIDWGDLEPRPGRSDLLVEYVWVTGPDSSTYTLDATAAYEAVADLFDRERDIAVTWTETRIELETEQRPDVLTPETWTYYDDVLGRSQHAHNPLVTTVVLNPQQQQQHAGDILGAAFLRSMIATIDYGAHTRLYFHNDDLGTLNVSPVFESHVVTQDAAKVRAFGFEDSGVDGRLLWLRDADGDVLGAPSTLTWEPDWFAQTPLVRYDGFGEFRFRREYAELDTDTLASTLAHELGHTLGLCHAHDLECFQDFDAADQAARDTSTMSYNAPSDTLHFLESEWLQVEDYLRCPPQETLRLVADGGAEPDLRVAKYQASFEAVGSQRACGDLGPLERTFEAEPANHYEATVAPPAGGLGAAGSGATALSVHAVGTVALAGGALWAARRLLPGA